MSTSIIRLSWFVSMTFSQFLPYCTHSHLRSLIIYFSVLFVVVVIIPISYLVKLSFFVRYFVVFDFIDFNFCRLSVYAIDFMCTYRSRIATATPNIDILFKIQRVINSHKLQSYDDYIILWFSHSCQFETLLRSEQPQNRNQAINSTE